MPGAVLGACSLILPGAGQLLARRWVRGVLMLLVATAAGIGLIAYLRDQSLGSLAGDIVRREVLIGIFAANGAVFLLRAVCIVDAYRLGRRGSRVLQAGVLAALLALAAVPHAAVAYIDWDSYRTLSAVFPEEEPAEADAAVPFAPDSAYETKQPAAAVTFEDTKGPIETGPTISETASARSSAAAFGTPLGGTGHDGQPRAAGGAVGAQRPPDGAAARRRPRAGPLRHPHGHDDRALGQREDEERGAVLAPPQHVGRPAAAGRRRPLRRHLRQPAQLAVPVRARPPGGVPRGPRPGRDGAQAGHREPARHPHRLLRAGRLRAASST